MLLDRGLVEHRGDLQLIISTPDLTSPDMTSYTLDSTAGAWPHQVKFTLPGHLFTHLGFPECPCCLGVTFIPSFVMFMH